MRLNKNIAVTFLIALFFFGCVKRNRISILQNPALTPASGNTKANSGSEQTSGSSAGTQGSGSTSAHGSAATDVKSNITGSSTLELGHVTLRIANIPNIFMPVDAAGETRISLVNNDIASGVIQLSCGLQDSAGKITSLLEERIPLSLSFSISRAMALPTHTAGEFDFILEVRDAANATAVLQRSVRHLSIRARSSHLGGAPMVAWLSPGSLLPTPMTRKLKSTGKNGLDQSIIHDTMVAIRNAGISTVVLTEVEKSGNYFYPSSFPFQDADVGKRTLYWQNNADVNWLVTPFDVVAAFLDEAAKNNIAVFIGLGKSGDSGLMQALYNSNTLHTPPAPDSLQRDLDKRLSDALFHDQAKATELWGAYNNSSSFYGWYLSQEPFDFGSAESYLEPMAAHLHNLTPEKPVMVSPSTDPMLFATQAKYIDLLKNTGIDIFAYQDQIGAGYDASQKKFTFVSDARPSQLDSYFQNLRSLHNSANSGKKSNFKQLWARADAWEMDGTSAAAGAFGDAYPAPSQRLVNQLTTESKSVDALGFYDFWSTMEPDDSTYTFLSPLNKKDNFGDRARSLWKNLAAFLLAN